MNNYKYDHIIHILLQKHGWVRVPWFVSLREVQERFYNAKKIARGIPNGYRL